MRAGGGYERGHQCLFSAYFQPISEFLCAKRLFSFVLALLVPLGSSRKLKRHGEKVASMKIFASGKPAGLTRDLPLGIFPKLGILYMNKGWINNVNFDEDDVNVVRLST